MRKGSRIIYYILGYILILVSIFLFSTIGSSSLTPVDSFKVLANHFLGVFDLSELPVNSHIIVINVRLPRVIGAALSGIGLTIAGIIYQSILRNPMAEPYVLGVSSGAALGAALSIVLNIFFTPLFSLIGALIASFVVILISGNRISSNRVILFGISFNFFLSALLTLLISFNPHKAGDIMFWTMGSFATMSYKKIVILMITLLIVTILSFRFRKELNIFTLGNETALSLGLDIKKYRIILLTTASVITGVIVSFSGIIGFVGLIIPHLTRLLVGSEHKRVLSISIPLGATFMVYCDTIARTILANELPVGVITSLIGAPIFVYLLKKRGDK